MCTGTTLRQSITTIKGCGLMVVEVLFFLIISSTRNVINICALSIGLIAITATFWDPSDFILMFYLFLKQKFTGSIFPGMPTMKSVEIQTTENIKNVCSIFSIDVLVFHTDNGMKILNEIRIVVLKFSKSRRKCNST